VIARSFVGIGLGYALGSLCAGYYLVRWRTGRDVRQTGSASAGARNAGRLLGPGGFVLVLTFDLLKGVTAVAGARALGLDDLALGIAVVAVVVGHVLPIQLAFRGGKGIAPSIGALLAYDAWALLVSAVVFGLAYVISGGRLVPSGLVAYALAPVTGLVLRRPRVELAVLAALAVVVLVAHRGHIRRALGLGAAMS
jgi:acyl phosphate:glycerol-3-phosphate acyltransferase